MSTVTLILTRAPVREFVWKGDTIKEVDNLSDEERKRLYLPRNASATDKPSVSLYSGRWGTLGVVIGPRVERVAFTATTAGSSVVGRAVGVMGMGADVVLNLMIASKPGGSAAAATTHFLPFADRTLELVTEHGPIEAITEYTTIERYRNNLGDRGHGYVMLHAKEHPYGLRVELNNSVVRTLRKNHSGNCIRVLGGDPGAEQGILIHEAPTVGWLIGCISPRPKNDRRVFHNIDGNPSFTAMNEILEVMKKFGHGRGALFVLRN
jgi:hypothetical protein